MPVHDVPRTAAPVVASPPMSIDAARAKLEQTRAAWESGDRSPAVIASFEAAGRALRRHGTPMRAFVAISSENPRTTADGRVHVPISDHEGEDAVLAVFAVEDAGKARAARRAPLLFPRKIVLRAPVGFETKVAADDAIVASSEKGAWIFPSIDRPPLAYLGRARASLDGRGRGLVIVAGDDSDVGATAHVVDVARGVERFARAGVSAHELLFGFDGRWLEQCPYQGGRAFVIDAATGHDLFASAGDVRACTVDAWKARVAVAYDEPGGQRVEVWSLAPPAKVGEAHRKGAALDSPSVSFTTASDAVELESTPHGGERKTMGRWSATTLRPVPAPTSRARPRAAKKVAPPLGPDAARRAIAQLPRGAATDAADLADLASLASPGAKLLEPFHWGSAGWAQNGVLSKDGATLALIEEDAPEAGNPALILVDVPTLARRHRVALAPRDDHWTTVYFLDDATVVVRLGWSYSVIDVASGALLMEGAYGVDAAPRSYESPRLLAPNLLAMGPTLFDLSRERPSTASRRVTDAPFLSHGIERRADGGRVTLAADGITAVVDADGDVRVAGGAIPSWILCEISDDLYPWPACR